MPQRAALRPVASTTPKRPTATSASSATTSQNSGPEERVVTENLMFQIDDDLFALVDRYSQLNLAAGFRIEIFLHTTSGLSVCHGAVILEANTVGRRLRNALIVGAKDLNARLDRRVPNPKEAHSPAATHPWRQSSLSR